MDGELTCDHLHGLVPGAYKCGAVWGIRVDVAGISLYHQGSANLDDGELRDGPVDVFLAGVAGRSVTPRYWERILPRLDPRMIVPTHYDNFFSPLGAPRTSCDASTWPAYPERWPPSRATRGWRRWHASMTPHKRRSNDRTISPTPTPAPRPQAAIQ